MRKHTALMSAMLLVLFCMFGGAHEAFAVDPPHNGQNSLPMLIQCSTCHYDTTQPPPSWATDQTTTDNTYFNNLCRSCHIGGILDPNYVVKTHSSGQMASGKYPPWTVECRVCHNPHYQDQVSSYPTETTSNLLTGTIASYAQAPVSSPTSTIYVNASGLVPNDWVDYMLVPNTAYPTKMYRILRNDRNAQNQDYFVVIGSINGRYAQPGSTFGIRLSSMLLAQLRTPLGVVESVKFFTADSSKPNSYASSTNSDNVTGICQVCHTQTQSFNRTATRTGGTGSIQEGPNHPAVIATGQKCTGCHIHTEGFKGECNSCHGYPPNSPSTLVFLNKSAATVTSDSGSGPGAHVAHVDTQQMVCSNCHANGMLSGASAGDDHINIGFDYLNGTTTGSYDGKASRSVYPYSANVTTGNTYRCSNIYCHSSGQGSTSRNVTPVYATPQWNVPSSGSCGTCHQTKAGHALGAITSGSHTRHMSTAGGSGCGDCHTGAADDASSYVSANHVNKLIDVANNYTAGGGAGNGYGTCSTAVCHASVYGPTTIMTPTWGTPAACNACHTVPIASTGPATGGHALHGYTDCTLCHNADTSSTTKPSSGHADGDIDVANVGYPPNVAKHAAGSGYSSCSAASCHANVYGNGTSTTPVWGSTGNNCNACHSIPIAATGPATGGHALHGYTDCTFCHNVGTTSTSKPTTSHADGDIDIANVGYPPNVAKHAAGSGYSSCSAASCHANVYGVGTSPTPTWGTSGNGCSACHSIAIAATGPNTGGHAQHGYTDCTFCHNVGTTSTSKPTTSHADGDIDIANVGYPPNRAKHAASSGYATCSAASCHANVYGPGTSPTPTWGTSGNGCSACHSIPIAATGPNTGSHALHAISAGTACTNCHTAGTSSTTKPTIAHADGDIDIVNVNYPPNVTKHAAGSGYSSCNTTACHGNTSPFWGANTTNAQCTKCHGVFGTSTASYIANPDLAAPGYNLVGRDTSSSSGNPTPGGVSLDPQVGAHNTHLTGSGGYKANGIACTDCHAVSSLTASGHMNGSTTFVWSSLATLSGALTPSYNRATGQCSNVYCHGAGMKYPADQGSDITPQWTDGNYLTSNATAMVFSDCNKCHLSPAINSSYDHGTVGWGANACNACHEHDGSSDKHMDGILQATGGACDACHSYDVDSDDDWGYSPKAVEGWGAHAVHIAHLKTVNSVTLSAATNTFGGPVYAKVCGVCHTLSVDLHSMSSQTNVRSITFGGSNAYQFASNGTPTYSGITGTSSQFAPKTCSNVSCHFQQSPVWEGY